MINKFLVIRLFFKCEKNRFSNTLQKVESLFFQISLIPRLIHIKFETLKPPSVHNIFILYQADPVVEGVVEELPGQLASFTFETSIAGSYAGKTHLVDGVNYRYNN